MTADRATGSRAIFSGKRIEQHVLIELRRLHGRFMRQRTGLRAALDLCDLSRLDFRGFDFSEAQFIRCNFAGALLRGASLRTAVLWGSFFDGSDLSDADCSGSQFYAGAERRLANRAGPSAESPAYMHDPPRLPLVARFCRALLRRTILRGCDLRCASFRAAYLEDADLANARLDGADFLRASLIRCRPSAPWPTRRTVEKDKSCEAGS